MRAKMVMGVVLEVAVKAFLGGLEVASEAGVVLVLWSSFVWNWVLEVVVWWGMRSWCGWMRKSLQEKLIIFLPGISYASFKAMFASRDNRFSTERKQTFFYY